KEIDLNRWLKGAYVIPARDDEDEPDDDPAK
ncbi:MAG: DNA gyrase inhibitor YacG, partial [Mesorhizobium sp.]